MKLLRSRFFFFFLFFSISVAGSGGVKFNRRILHQPLFPVTSTPPPTLSPPIPPDAPDQPFFPEIPSTLDQSQYSPPPPPLASAAVNGGLPIPTPKHGRKIAIVISVGIVTLGMISALAFFLYRHKAKNARETQKFVSGGGNGGGSLRFQGDPRPPTTTSTFLYTGTVEPNRESSTESNGPVNSSPNRKLNSVMRSDRNRRSPELQPLPQLAKPHSPPALSPTSSSSDEKCRDAAFYTPHGSTISRNEGYYKAFPLSGSIPHSKRTSPRSKFGSPATAGTMAASRSPEMKHVIIPSINHKPVQPLPLRGFESDEEVLHYSKNKPKFSQPPPSPDRAAFQAITQDYSPLSSLKPPRRSPPPLNSPPPTPPQKQRLKDSQIPQKLINSEETNLVMSVLSSSKEAVKTPSPKSEVVEEANTESVGYLEKTF